MGKYQAYPEYKDSGIAWIGQVPEHWDLSQAKHSFVLQRGHDLASDEMIEGEYPVYGSNGQIGTHAEFTTKAPCLTVGRSGSVGEINYITKDFWAHNTSLYVKEFKGSPPRYIYYLLIALNPKRLSAGSAVGTLDRNNIHTQIIASPSYIEAELIANFLDHETAKIDTLIEKQQQLIQLLKEKRQAVISHAVTKGLNPNAPMKDSGVEWLGEVPEHWGVSKIKNIVSIPVTDGPHETPNFIDDGVPFVSAEAVSSGEVDFNKIRGFISEEANNVYSKKYSPKKYDIYMVKSGATTGVTAIVETDDVFNIWSPLAVIRCGNKVVPYFVLNFMRSEPFQEAIKLNWSFGTQQNIGMGVIENLHVTCPPKSEAEEIARFLQGENQKFKSVVSSAYDAIQLMQERRTALISAAVTGKIDVRLHASHPTGSA